MKSENTNNQQAQLLALELFSSDSFLSINKQILSKYGPKLTVYLCNLIDKMKYFLQNDKLGDDLSFFLTQQNQTKQIGMSEYQLRKCKKKLKKMGILHTKARGIPPKEFYILNLEILVNEFLMDYPQKTKGITLKKLKGLPSKNLRDINNNKDNNNKDNNNKDLMPKIKILDDPPFPTIKKSNQTKQNKTWESLSLKYGQDKVQFVRKFLLLQKKNYPNLIKEEIDPASKRVLSSLKTLSDLIRINKFDFSSEVKPLLEQVPNDPFWSKNLLSLGSLRDKKKNGEIKFVNILTTLNASSGSKEVQITPAAQITPTTVPIVPTMTPEKILEEKEKEYPSSTDGLLKISKAAINLVGGKGHEQEITIKIWDLCRWYETEQNKHKPACVQWGSGVDYPEKDDMGYMSFLAWRFHIPNYYELLVDYIKWFSRQAWLERIYVSHFTPTSKVFLRYLDDYQREVGCNFITGEWDRQKSR